MIKVYQTRFTSEDGNCFAACVASIFETTVEDIENGFIMHKHQPEEWFAAFNEWLKKRGFCAVDIGIADQDYAPVGTYHIASGQSPRFECKHSIVNFRNQMAHDPHPEGTGLKTVDDIIIFVPLDYSGMLKSVEAAG